MVARYGIFAVLALVISLSACKNRFEEYEPYSAFDERMAMADKSSFVPDDQVPSGMSDPYQSTQDFSPREPAAVAGNSSRGASDDMEVSFDDSRGQQKHPTNIGAL
jgi:hypothetical protein